MDQEDRGGEFWLKVMNEPGQQDRPWDLPVRELDVHNHPPELHDPSTMDRALLLPAAAYLSAGADSPQLSTETG